MRIDETPPAPLPEADPEIGRITTSLSEKIFYIGIGVVKKRAYSIHGRKIYITLVTVFNTFFHSVMILNLFFWFK